MNVLVTGGAGFVGSHIVDELVLAGHSVSIVDNFSSGKKEFVNPKAMVYERDITSSLIDIFSKEKPEIVIHTAAQVMLRKSIQEPIFDATTNIIGTINVLLACKECKVKRIIYTSTGGARYGEPAYLPVDENHQINPSSPYGISKHTAEHYIEAFSKLYGFDYLIFCFGNVYGPRDDPAFGRVIAVFSKLIIEGKPPVIFGDGLQTRDFVFVKDLAGFIVDSISKSPKSRLFNLANGEQVSVKQIFDGLIEISGSKLEAIHSPAVSGEVRDIVLNTVLAQKELDWKPKTSLKEGLNQTFDYFLQRKF